MTRGQALAGAGTLALGLGVGLALRPLLATGVTLRLAPAESPAHRRVAAVAFSRTNEALSVGSEGWLRRWHVPSGEPLGGWRLTPESVNVVAAKFSGDGAILAVSRLDGVFEVWDVPPLRLIRRFRHPDVDNYGFSLLSLSRDGTRLAVSPAMGSAGVWETRSGQLRLSLPADATRWGRMALSPNGDRLACSGRQPLEVWDVERGVLLTRMDRTTVDPMEMAWTPDGRQLALAPNLHDKLPDQLSLADTNARQDRRRMENVPGGGTNALAFSPDGEGLAGAMVAATVDAGASLPQARALPQVWERDSRRARFARSEPLPYAGHTRGVTSLAWSPDSRRLVSGGLEGSVIFWDARTGERVGIARR